MTFFNFKNNNFKIDSRTFKNMFVCSLSLLIITFFMLASVNSKADEVDNNGIYLDNIGSEAIYSLLDRTYLGEWYLDGEPILVYNALGSYNTSVTNAMTRWNNVDFLSGEDILTLQTTTDRNATLNTIEWDELEIGVIGSCPTVLDGNEICAFTLTLSSAEDILWAQGSVSGKYDINTVLTHELGHALGVPHCHVKGPIKDQEICESSSCSSNVMNPYISKGEVRTTLTVDDRITYRNIYN